MTGLGDLYQEMILDHNKRPRNFGKVPDANRTARGHNPLCGDRITVTMKVDGDRIEEIAFEGQGCAISKASASLMTSAVKGKSRAEAEALFDAFRKMVTGEPPSPECRQVIGKLEVFSGVSEFPARVKCATLAWHTLKGALESPGNTVTTE
jgi:nitrogen fixation NifU-like protein